MLLAVAGLDRLQVSRRVETLASGDWSAFAPRERVLLMFARKLSQAPASIAAEDVQQMVRHWGEQRTLDWIYHISWCNFMTRVADAFQIPLESENVFLPPEKPAAAEPRDPDAKTGG